MRPILKPESSRIETGKISGVRYVDKLFSLVNYDRPNVEDDPPLCSA